MKSAACPFKQIAWNDLDPVYLRQLIDLAWREDLDALGWLGAPSFRGDLTTLALMDHAREGRARLVARRPLVLSGNGLVPLILERYGDACTYAPMSRDGDHLQAGDCLGVLSGDAAQMLQAERVILNFLQHLSGIATQTSLYVSCLQGYATRVLDTRKTTPGYRVLEKYAVACGGGWNHRMGLYEWILVKDNHLCSTESVGGQSLMQRIRMARAAFPSAVLEVEVDVMEQIEPVLQAGVDVLMLDNFTIGDLESAVRQVAGRALTEASGGVELDRLARIAATGVDFVSSGALIHQSRWVDIGMDWGQA
jgi:nicotinate-nucleotide pyrophosphorylase (carboxylating)